VRGGVWVCVGRGVCEWVGRGVWGCRAGFMWLCAPATGAHVSWRTNPPKVCLVCVRCPLCCAVLCCARFIDAASRYYDLSSISIRQLGDKAISEEDLLSE